MFTYYFSSSNVIVPIAFPFALLCHISHLIILLVVTLLFSSILYIPLLGIVMIFHTIFVIFYGFYFYISKFYVCFFLFLMGA